MESLFYKITEENKLNLNKPVDSDMVYYSELNKWFTSNAFRSFSLKYVIDNCIHYRAGKKEHQLYSGDFMLACKQPFVKAFFDTDIVVKSICIDIRPETVDEAFTVMLAKEDFDFDNYLNHYFKHPNFFEAVCPVKSAPVFQSKLNNLVKCIHSGAVHEHLNREWFLDLVEKIIYHEYGNYLALNGIHSVKLSTRKEILQRIKKGKEYMDENFLNISEITEVATVCNLSEFHFFRSFKQAFSITPYQYLLSKRLDLAKSLLSDKILSVNKVAVQCSFPDLATFSKAFKKHCGMAPSQYISK